MKKCCVCKNAITNDEPASLFIGNDGNYREICTACEEMLETLTQSDIAEEIEDAVNYFYTCSLSLNDDELRSYLEDMIESATADIEEMEHDKAINEPVNMLHKQNYFADRSLDGNGATFWISGMKIFAWCTFAGIIILGLVLAVWMGRENSGGIGFLIFLGSGVLAFLSVAMEMIFLNLAQDISKIKHDVSKIKQELQKG